MERKFEKIKINVNGTEVIVEIEDPGHRKEIEEQFNAFMNKYIEEHISEWGEQIKKLLEKRYNL